MARDIDAATPTSGGSRDWLRWCERVVVTSLSAGVSSLVNTAYTPVLVRSRARAMRRLVELWRTRDDLDKWRSEPITLAAVVGATRVIFGVRWWMATFIYPTPSGGISLEWDCGADDIVIGSDGLAEGGDLEFAITLARAQAKWHLRLRHFAWGRTDA